MIVGVLGGGQLGRMLGLAGLPLGLRFRFLDPDLQAPAGDAGTLLVGPYDDPESLARLADGASVVTWEFENVPDAAARLLASRVAVHPAPAALRVAQDRLAEKRLFQRVGIPTAPFVTVDSRGELDRALAEIGLPAVLKTRRLGYDGKGQVVLDAPGEVAPAWDRLGGVPLILEGFVPFQRELSAIAVRARDGETAFYPLVQNLHRDGILRRTVAPAPGLTPALERLAESHALRLLDALDYVGVLAVELFERDGVLLANEMAPRVHNSGHWTIEGAETSQFENHLRAVLGWPLGPTAAVGASVMINLIGALPDPAVVLAVPGAHLHRYGKEPRPGRKVGHVTVRAASAAQAQALAARVAGL